MKILVTGGAGYIGSVLTGKLLELGHKVTVVDNFRHGYQGIVHLATHPNLEIIKRNILDPNRDYLKDKDFIFHLAAITSNKDCEDNKVEAFRINGSVLDDIAHGACKTPVLYTSTTAIYGDRQGGHVDEGASVLSSIHGVYSHSKYTGERFLGKYDNSIILRLGTVYGVSPMMRPHSIVNDFVRMAVQDKIITVYGADTLRPYIHVRDCANGLISAMDNPNDMMGNTYNFFTSITSKKAIALYLQGPTDCEVFISEKIEKFPQNFNISFSDIGFYDINSIHSILSSIDSLIKLYSFYD